MVLPIIKILIAFIVKLHILLLSLLNGNFGIIELLLLLYSNDMNCLVFVLCLSVLFLSFDMVS
jgi:hypothetical protein